MENGAQATAQPRSDVWLDFAFSAATVGILCLFTLGKIGKSEFERLTFLFALYSLFFIFFLVTFYLCPKKIKDFFARAAQLFLLEGMLLFTAAMAFMAFTAIGTGAEPTIMLDMRLFSAFYLAYCAFIKYLANSRFLLLALVGGLLLPLVVGGVVALLVFICRMLGIAYSCDPRGLYFKAFVFIDVAVTISTGWYFALSKKLAFLPWVR